MSDRPSNRSRDAHSSPVGRPRRDQQALLDAAAAVFVASGVDAPVREIAANAGVGVGTIYRHFPSRADLVVAVYRHQVEACADAGPRLLAESETPEAALQAWVAMFVDFLTTKHGLADALQGDTTRSGDALHTYFVGRLVPVCASLLDAARQPADAYPPIDAYSVLKGIGNLCIGAASDTDYDAATPVRLLLSGLLTRDG
ncbi:TetR/AcrR family transcriptional regulator [Microbacterium aurugineum]|uniref:TetR/AcrR family transcriptional regulator n=1 Tax=Microbacterium TaxID=33882 RepID=UPI001E2C50EF|nr:TetR/AcrR family transcriptional regulator [Microbacterium sp. KKR3/1]MCE0510728.1 TetR/AcrR family transcriptional regulator [Microbacterium sp. KKR3/1]